jgi:Permuted papain-like amidase enzyme, YaeF/YiiX, C92 family
MDAATMPEARSPDQPIFAGMQSKCRSRRSSATNPAEKSRVRQVACPLRRSVREPKRNGFRLKFKSNNATLGTQPGAGKNVMGWVLDRIGHALARYLEKEASGYEPFTPSAPNALRGSLKPGDVLLIEGNNHISGVIKYLTQSTWSHAALYVGPLDGRTTEDGEPHVLIEAEIGQGVVTAPLSKYIRFHTRVCRPVGLAELDCARVCAYAIERVGLAYDLKNITDLLRYLLPLPIPQRWRRRMIALGSGDPTKIICSALIAQAFQSVRYPILAKATTTQSRAARREILEIRHHSLYAPRDFDISPYFAVVKPTIETGFDYKKLHWADLPLPPEEPAPELFAEPATAFAPVAAEPAPARERRLASAA